VAAETGVVVNRMPFTYGFHPLAREMRARVAADNFGAVHLIHGSYRQDWLLSSTSTRCAGRPRLADERQREAEAVRSDDILVRAMRNADRGRRHYRGDPFPGDPFGQVEPVRADVNERARRAVPPGELHQLKDTGSAPLRVLCTVASPSSLDDLRTVHDPEA
jgi:hypothetical protein